MNVIRTPLPEVIILEPKVFADERGWFMECFNERAFHSALNTLGLTPPPAFVQDNHSVSQQDVLRGLHYQLPPHAQGKLVRVIKGAAYDVAVDIRRDSPHFGQWTAVELSAENRRTLWVPAGFAHGFLSLQDDTHFLYKTTDYYHSAAERSIAWNDPTLAIPWPLHSTPKLSPKDASAPLLAQAQLPEPMASRSI